MRKHLRWIPALILALAAPLSGQSPAALVMQLRGSVQVNHAGASSAAAVGQRLMAGDEVVPSAGARALLITATGATQQVTKNTTLAVPPTGASDAIFEMALQRLVEAGSASARTGGRQGMIRPIPGEPTLVSPRNGLTVSTMRPAFEWMATSSHEATGYTIQIRSLDGGKPVRFNVTGTTFTLPDDAEPLKPGTAYAWTVAPKGGRAAQEVRFRVIGPDQEAQLGTTLGQIKELGLDPTKDGAFLAAVVYRDLNLYYDAAAALDAVEAEGSMAAEGYLLKGEILNQLGHEEAAREAFDRADEMMR